jgi:hypothetical protein
MTATCEREGCSTRFMVTHPLRRFCSERCRRIVANRRYRAQRTEVTICQRCGTSFERTVTSKRVKVYCSLACQYEERSADYRKRADIQATLKRGRRTQARTAKGRPAERVVIFS